MPHSKASPIRVRALERRNKALELRRKGKTYSEIGKELGIDKSRAWALVMEEVRNLTKLKEERAEEIVALERERLDALQSALWDRAMKGDVKAVEAILKIMSRRSSMLGLDEPTKTKTEFAFNSMTNAELMAQARMAGVDVPLELESQEPLALEHKPILEIEDDEWDLEQPEPAGGVGLESTSDA